MIIPGNVKCQLFFIFPFESKSLQLFYLLITDWGLLVTIQHFILTSLVSCSASEICVLSIFLSNITVPPLLIELHYLLKPLIPSDGKWELTVIIPLESKSLLLLYSLIVDEGILATLRRYSLTYPVDHQSRELWVLSMLLRSITVPLLLLEHDYLW